VFHAFSLLCRIPLCEYITTDRSIFLLMDAQAFSSLLLLMTLL
jgi:hypothetical protein